MIKPVLAKLLPVITAMIVVMLLALKLTGCASYQQVVQAQGFSDVVLQGSIYRHRVLKNQVSQMQSTHKHWHVYIEGDGRAVDSRGRPNLDPTPRSPLLLEMMTHDSAAALYLGRPCYFDTEDPSCSPINWTLARYSEETVASMTQALRLSIPDTDVITLIGHSGGGTLAVLIAPRLANVKRVITLAGNLNVAQWTRHHSYSPLSLSLDPATQPPLSKSVQQIHIAGAKDQEILPQWIEIFVKNQPDACFLSLQQADHRSGWPLWWTLVDLKSTMDSQRCGTKLVTK